jgi:hypothetical protein
VINTILAPRAITSVVYTTHANTYPDTSDTMARAYRCNLLRETLLRTSLGTRLLSSPYSIDMELPIFTGNFVQLLPSYLDI